MIVYYANSAIAKGKPQEAVTRVDETRKAHARDLSVLHARWLLALASADWDHAAQMEKALQPLETSQTTWWRTTKQMRLKGDPAFDSKVDAAMRSRDLEPIAVDLKIERLIQNGDFSQSADLLAENAKDIEPTGLAMLEAYTAGGFLPSERCGLTWL